MKKILLLIAFVALYAFGYAQETGANTKPLIIEGQLKNYKDKQISIGWHKADGEWVQDVADVNADGTFYLETYKVTKPLVVAFQFQNSIFTYFYAAPGYKLTINADC